MWGEEKISKSEKALGVEEGMVSWADFLWVRSWAEMQGVGIVRGLGEEKVSSRIQWEGLEEEIFLALLDLWLVEEYLGQILGQKVVEDSQMRQ